MPNVPAENPKSPLWKLSGHPSHFALMRQAVQISAAGSDADMRRAGQRCEEALDDSVNPNQDWPEPLYVAPELRAARVAQFMAENPKAINDKDLLCEITLSTKALGFLQKAMADFASRINTSFSVVYDACLDDLDAAVKLS